jgi:hypothetical protein
MDEPISPELVSVDPELAATARAALPEEPWQMFIPAPAPEPEPAPPPVATQPPLVTPRRSLRGAGIGLAFVAAAVAGIVVGTTDAFKRANDRPSFAAEPPAAAPSVVATTGVATTVAPPSVTAAPAPAPTAPMPTTTTRRPAPTTKSAAGDTFVPSRIFAWAPVPGADHYRVRFYRGGDVVLEGSPKQARFVLPPRFEFEPGTYRWTVEPRRGDTYRAPLVDSRFKVSG